ncbi:CMRF35-like molecule 3 [Brachionichthys hirsutus]|uniref:CMRF35-like molecule 3 n=1 Tax=Brachionichthys hirsutus TaxID=412623 RepID=UPI003604BD6A
MRISGILSGFFNVPVLYLLWVSKHGVESMLLSGPPEVTGAQGASVTIHCRYHQMFRNHTKYWCKGRAYYQCTILVKTPRNRPSIRNSIADDKDAGVFAVTMTSLRDSDDDKYWCVIAKRGKNVFTGVRLRISHTASHTVTTAILPATSSLPAMAEGETSWWASLRWILFVLMLGCLAATHVIVWRIKTSRQILQDRQIQCQNQNIYD